MGFIVEAFAPGADYFWPAGDLLRQRDPDRKTRAGPQGKGGLLGKRRGSGGHVESEF